MVGHRHQVRIQRMHMGGLGGQSRHAQDVGGVSQASVRRNRGLALPQPDQAGGEDRRRGHQMQRGDRVIAVLDPGDQRAHRVDGFQREQGRVGRTQVLEHCDSGGAQRRLPVLRGAGSSRNCSNNIAITPS